MAKNTYNFKTKFRGYSKKEVNDRIEELENKVNFLTEKFQEIKTEYERKNALFKAELGNIEENKQKIAEIYMAAHTNAEAIVEKAKNDTIEKQHIFEIENEALKETIVERKETIRNIRLTMQSFSSQLEGYFGKLLESINNDIQSTVKELDYEFLEKLTPGGNFDIDDKVIFEQDEMDETPAPDFHNNDVPQFNDISKFSDEAATESNYNMAEFNNNINEIKDSIVEINNAAEMNGSTAQNSDISQDLDINNIDFNNIDFTQSGEV